MIVVLCFVLLKRRYHDSFLLWHNMQVKEAIFRTLITNGMFDNTHIRLSLTRGKKVFQLSSTPI